MTMDGGGAAQRDLASRVAALEEDLARIRRSEWVWPPVVGGRPATPTVEELPPPDDLQAYRVLTLRGTPDATYQCLRNFDGEWVWVAIGTAGLVAAINFLLEGSLVGTRNTLNFRAGDGIDLTVTDDSVNGRVSVEVAVDDAELVTQSQFATHATRHEPGGADEMSDIAYTPAVPGDWSPAPSTGSEAWDQLAARVAVLEP